MYRHSKLQGAIELAIVRQIESSDLLRGGKVEDHLPMFIHCLTQDILAAVAAVYDTKSK